MATASEALAEFLASLEFTGLPTAVRDQTQLVLLEAVGAMTGGARYPHVEHLAAVAAEQEPGPGTLCGFGATAAPRSAALVNGAAATALEVVGGHRWSYGMPSIAAIPAALAVAERQQASGSALLAAIVAGYEAGARVSMACVPWRDAFHAHGSLSMIAAAVSVAHLRGFSADQMNRLLDVASVLPIFAHRRTTWAGGTVHNAYPAVSAFHGILATDLVLAGFTAPTDGLAGSFGDIAAEEFDASRLTSDLGRPYEIVRGYLKTHAGDRHLHPAIDALSGALEGRSLAPEDVEKVEVHTYFKAFRCGDQEPGNYLASRWSIPHALAVRIALGHARWRAFTEAVVADPVVASLRRRVHVHEDASYTRIEPDERPARVAITLKNGTCLEHEVRFPSGDPESPSNLEDAVVRFRDAVEGVLEPRRIGQLEARLLDAASLSDVSEITRCTRSSHPPSERPVHAHAMNEPRGI